MEKHKAANVYGPLKKLIPNCCIEALRWYSQLHLGDSLYFIAAPSSGMGMVLISHILSAACTTFGHPGACPNTNFLRKLYHTYVSSEGGILGDKYNNDLRGLAEIDAHSVEMALSVHYDLSDITDGPLVKKSIRASWSLNKGMPVAPPEDILTEGVGGTKCQHGQKRQGEDKS